jgi:hypothetical protein
MRSDQMLDFIASHVKELAKIAEDAQQETLAYTLRIAEREALEQIASKKKKI